MWGVGRPQFGVLKGNREGFPGRSCAIRKSLSLVEDAGFEGEAGFGIDNLSLDP